MDYMANKKKIRDALEAWAKDEMERFPHLREDMQKMLDSASSMNKLTEIVGTALDNAARSEYTLRKEGRVIYGGDMGDPDPQ